MDLAEPQAVSFQTRFLPEGVAQGTDDSQGNGQVVSSLFDTFCRLNIEMAFNLECGAYLKKFAVRYLSEWRPAVRTGANTTTTTTWHATAVLTKACGA